MMVICNLMRESSEMSKERPNLHQPTIIQDGLTVAHLQKGLTISHIKNGLTTSHLGEGLAKPPSAAPSATVPSTPTAAPPAQKIK
jgi:hypothetical protein